MLNYASAILTVLAAMICLSSCGRDDVPAEGQGTGRFITFTAVEDSVWPGITKGAISSVGDLLGDGFMVWGSWTRDPEDDVKYVDDEYSSGKNGAIYNYEGTVVTATDENEDEEFNQDDDVWSYGPAKEWRRGYYSFAAAIPASAFGDNKLSGAHYSQSDASTGFTFSASGAVEGVTYNNRLTLDFPDDLFVLGGKSVSGTKLPSSAQADLMYAFCEIDNSGNDAGNVALDFEHLCAKLSIELSVENTSKTMSVQKITIYGLLNAIPTPLEFTRTVTAAKTAEHSNFQDMLDAAAEDPETYRSTQESPFAVFTRPGDSDKAEKWDVACDESGNPVSVPLVEDLIVFPGALSEDNPLRIMIDYNSGDEPMRFFVKTVKEVWEAGKAYTYTLKADLSE